MFGREQKQAGSKTGAGPFKLHSIPVMLRGRIFEGRFDVRGAGYNFSYAPTRAAVVGGKLQLAGDVTVSARSGARRSLPNLRNVRATLVAAQGGIGTAPARNRLPAEISTSRPDLGPIVESTGSLSFCGVLYFKLASMNGRLLATPADMRHIQLNVRLAPVSDHERTLQAVFSSIVDAVLSHPADAAAAEKAVVELNSILAAG